MLRTQRRSLWWGMNDSISFNQSLESVVRTSEAVAAVCQAVLRGSCLESRIIYISWADKLTVSTTVTNIKITRADFDTCGCLPTLFTTNPPPSTYPPPHQVNMPDQVRLGSEALAGSWLDDPCTHASGPDPFGQNPTKSARTKLDPGRSCTK